jgi:hypothetical protein
MQSNMALAIAASAFLNMALVLASSATPSRAAAVGAKAAFTLAGLFGVQVPAGLLRLQALDAQITELKES